MFLNNPILKKYSEKLSIALFITLSSFLFSCDSSSEGYQWLIDQQGGVSTGEFSEEITEEYSFALSNIQGEYDFLLDLDGTMDIFIIVLNAEDPAAGSLVQIREMSGDQTGRVIFQAVADAAGDASGNLSLNTTTNEMSLDLNYEGQTYYFSDIEIVNLTKINSTVYLSTKLSSSNPPIDTDGDGVPDADDVCPEDPSKTEDAGECGCGVPDTDSDADGIADCNDEFPTDADNDGISTIDDCDDNDSEIGAPTTWYIDNDGDGLGDPEVSETDCEQPEGYVANSDDENDNDFDNDGIETDVDCDDSDSEIGVATLWYADSDGDGLGDPEVSETDCDQPEGYVANDDDENDNDFDNDGIELEEDCDDEDADVGVATEWFADADGDGLGDPEVSETACEQPEGYVANADDENDNDFDNDGIEIEEDCDDEDADVGVATEWFADADGDGLGDPEVSETDCEQPDGYVVNADDENDNDFDNDGIEIEEDCDDEDADVGVATEWFADADGDGFGNPEISKTACDQPDGYVEDGTDTDDTNEYINPNNAAPIADAGSDQTIYIGQTATLDGINSSDPDLDVISFSWTITSKPVGSATNLDNSSSSTPSFTPDLPGTYIVSLIVNDNPVDSNPDEVVITVKSAEELGQDLIQEIYAMIESGSIDKRRGYTLVLKVKSALKVYDRGSERGAILLLKSFIFKVKLYAWFRRISNEDGSKLIAGAEDLISAIESSEEKKRHPYHQHHKVSPKENIQVKLYPTPTVNWLNVQNIPDEIQEYAIYEIVNSTIVNSGSINSSKMEINIAHLKPGIYILKLGSKQYRIVKSK